MADYTQKPRITSSRKKSVCAETGQKIMKWDDILYVPEGKKVYCKDSEEYKNHIASRAKKGGSDE